ncbi:superinfection exclusion B family protein [Mesobacillus subterraneus]|uniref:super-infection exclusion protein B n=1 Tax=Mesobacillus subterraneus TaxID=285983 RepID=UPI00203C4956|nr:super-infection exclusion protein B [Mesobacillus subterraneus]MCM3574711.1 superinfection exclusion B family protein [Mesobacillus subterraneus]
MKQPRRVHPKRKSSKLINGCFLGISLIVSTAEYQFSEGERVKMPKFDIKDLLTLPPKILAALAVGAGLILFLPNEIINKLYLLSFKEKFGFVLGITFTISVSILLMSVIGFIINSILSSWLSKKKIQQYKQTLYKLNMYEKSIIAALYERPDNTLNLPINKGIIRKLTHSHIISPVSSQAIVYGDSEEWSMPYFLQPWVIEFIQENPEFLKDNQAIEIEMG